MESCFMWKHSKKWIIESSVALLFLFVIPFILIQNDCITIRINSNVVLIFCAYCIFIFSFYFSRFINTGLYALFDIITHNVKTDTINILYFESNSFFWNAYYKQNTRSFSDYYSIYCEKKSNKKTSKFYSDIPIKPEEKEVKIRYLGASKIIISLVSENSFKKSQSKELL